MHPFLCYDSYWNCSNPAFTRTLPLPVCPNRILSSKSYVSHSYEGSSWIPDAVRTSADEAISVCQRLLRGLARHRRGQFWSPVPGTCESQLSLSTPARGCHKVQGHRAKACNGDVYGHHVPSWRRCGGVLALYSILCLLYVVLERSRRGWVADPVVTPVFVDTTTSVVCSHILIVSNNLPATVGAVWKVTYYFAFSSGAVRRGVHGSQFFTPWMLCDVVSFYIQWVSFKFILMHVVQGVVADTRRPSWHQHF
jgi:hypothetical protein